MEQSNDPNAIVILRRAQVEKRTGLTKSGINNGSFPRPVPLGIRAVGWIEAEVSAWLSHKCEKRLTQAVR
jgi:prophage regulatory protein